MRFWASRWASHGSGLLLVKMAWMGEQKHVVVKTRGSAKVDERGRIYDPGRKAFLPPGTVFQGHGLPADLRVFRL